MNNWKNYLMGVCVVGMTLALGTACSAPPDMEDPLGDDPAGFEDPTTGDDPNAERVRLRVDDGMAHETPGVRGLFDGDDARPVGALETADGVKSEIVLNELIVSVYSEDQLQDILQRCGGVELDRFEADEFDEPDAPTDVLIAIDPNAIDAGNVAQELGAADSGLNGNVRVSGDAVVKTLAAAAKETALHGTQVGLNWIASMDGIEDETSMEGPNLGNPNAFDWSFIRSGSAQDIGVDAAWQLLEVRGKLANKVKIMIVDGGFSPNPDFPDELKIRQANWGDTNRVGCSGGNACPYHGTQVTIAAMGQMDNDYAGVGPAAPVGELIAVGIYKDQWKRLRRTKKMVKEERPHVVNMSFSSKITAFKGASENAANRHLKTMRNYGALLFASAGNDGINVDNRTCIGNSCSESVLIIPCESPHVVCVGGMGTDTTYKAEGSNYGTESGSRSVQIYGPFRTIGVIEPDNAYGNAGGKSVTGTSFSSPFVAGVAALVKAADPSLNSSEIWSILSSTAHDGGVGFDLVFENGSQKRINAYGAVLEALGLDYEEPQVAIDGPNDGAEYGIEHWFTLEGHATDMNGKTLPITWESSLDGELSDGAELGDVYLQTLSVGTHFITARAEDLRGGVGTASISVHVINEPPDVVIVTPDNGEAFYEGFPVDMFAYTRDPDTYQGLAEDDVSWEVRRTGSNQLVYANTGHVAKVPAGQLDPGSYKITLVGQDGGVSEEDTATIHVVGIPEDETVPTAIIDAPEDGLSLGTGNGPRLVDLEGRGTDPEDGQLSGTRMRWTAVSENGTHVIVCEGSNYGVGGPGLTPPEEEDDGELDLVAPGGGGIQLPDLDLVAFQDCAEATAELGIDPGSIGTTNWAITLEVMDSAGLVGKAKVFTEIYYAAP